MAPKRTPAPGGGQARPPAASPAATPAAPKAPRPPSSGAAPTPGGLRWTPAGGGQFIGGRPANVPGGTNQGRPQPGPMITQPLPGLPEDTGAEDGGSGYDPYAAFLAAQNAQDQQNTIAVVTALFKEYGLESLTPKIIEYVKAGYSGDAIGVLLRDTPEYKARFPAMATLMQKKRAISEAEYIAYERTAAQLEKQYGLPLGMVQGNVTRLLENEVSATELNDRIVMASSAAVTAPEDFKQTLQQYYNIGTGGLAAYFLDPAVAAPLLQKQVDVARIGTEAVRQGIGLDVYGAQNLQSLGITQEGAKQGFQTVARDISLTSGRGDVVSQQELISGTFGDQAQQTNIERARAARQGRFAGDGGFIGNESGVRGLASAAT